MRRITVTAQRLTEERGLDGFTLDELAEAVELSRRTLFNYFPSKIDAVLGPAPDPAEDVLDVFVSGGPTGDLVEDLIVVFRNVVDGAAFTREELALGCRVMAAEPRLLTAAHERFKTVSTEVSSYLVERTGHTVDLDCALLMVRVLAVAFDAALDRTLGDEEIDAESLGDMVATNIRTLRDLFADSGPTSNAPSTRPTARPRTSAQSGASRCRPGRADPRARTTTDQHHHPPPPGHRSNRLQETPMATLLYRLGKTAYRRWPFFLAGWLVALARRRHRRRDDVQADDRRLLDPGHPVGEGRRPPGRALPRRPGRLRPGDGQRRRRRPRGHTLAEPEPYSKAVDALIADLSRSTAGAGRRPRWPTRPTPAPAAGEQHGRRRPWRTARRATRPRPNAEALLAALRGRPRSARSPSHFDVDTVADVEPASQDAVLDALAEARDAGLTGRGQRLRACSPRCPARWRLGADRHRRRAARPDPHLRLAGRRRPADPHRDLRRRRSASPASPR